MLYLEMKFLVLYTPLPNAHNTQHTTRTHIHNTTHTPQGLVNLLQSFVERERVSGVFTADHN